MALWRRPPHYPPLVEPLRPGPTWVPHSLSNPLTNLLSVSPTPARTLLFFFALLPACVEIQEELSDGWTTRRVNGQNGSGLAPAAASLNGFVGGARKAVGGCACGCPGVGQRRRVRPHSGERGQPAPRMWGRARLLFTRKTLQLDLIGCGLSRIPAGTPARVARANGLLEATATYLVAGWAYAYPP